MLIWSQVAFHHGLVTTTSPRKLWRPWCARGFRGHLRVRFRFLHANLWWIYAALCGRTLKGVLGDAGGFRGGSLCWEVWDEWYAGRLLLYIYSIISVILTITITITINVNDNNENVDNNENNNKYADTWPGWYLILDSINTNHFQCTQCLPIALLKPLHRRTWNDRHVWTRRKRVLGFKKYRSWLKQTCERAGCAWYCIYIRYIIDKVFAIFFRTVETLNLAQWICLKIG